LRIGIFKSIYLDNIMRAELIAKRLCNVDLLCIGVSLFA